MTPVPGCQGDALQWKGQYSYASTASTTIEYYNPSGVQGPGRYTFCDYMNPPLDQIIGGDELLASREVQWQEESFDGTAFDRKLRFRAKKDGNQWLLYKIEILDDSGNWLWWEASGPSEGLLLVPLHADVFFCENVELDLYSE